MCKEKTYDIKHNTLLVFKSALFLKYWSQGSIKFANDFLKIVNKPKIYLLLYVVSLLYAENSSNICVQRAETSTILFWIFCHMSTILIPVLKSTIIQELIWIVHIPLINSCFNAYTVVILSQDENILQLCWISLLLFLFFYMNYRILELTVQSCYTQLRRRPVAIFLINVSYDWQIYFVTLDYCL